MDEVRRRVETCRLRERIDDEERRRERREIEKLGRDEAVAAAADPIMWRSVMVAPVPTQDALLETLDHRLGQTLR